MRRRHPKGYLPLPPSVLAPGETKRLIRARTNEEFERHVEQNRERNRKQRTRRVEFAALNGDPRAL